MTKKNEQMDGDRTAKTGYTYDKWGKLVMVKSHLEGEKEPDGSSAQYVQYVYDNQGNKVRQFTGMTEPLTLTVTEAEKDTKAEDTFTYAGKTYQLTVSGKKKTDTVAETKYEYDGKNQLVAFTNAFFHISTIKIYNNKKLLEILCDGAILPDYVQSKKKK